METNGLVGSDVQTSVPGMTHDLNVGETVTAQSPIVQLEKTFNQNELNEIVKKVKAETIEKERKRILEVSNPYTSTQQPSFDADAVKKMVAEETQKMRAAMEQDYQQRENNARGNQILQTLDSKILTAKEKYSDFDKVTANLGAERFLGTMSLLGQNIDNAGDVIYELAKDKSQFAEIERDCKDGWHDIALLKLQKLSQSIKDNNKVVKMRPANSPLSQMQSSAETLNVDGDIPSVSSLRAHFRM